MKTPSHEQPRGMERSSLRTLFILGHVPLYFFAVGIAVVSFGVLAVVDDEVRRVTAIAGQTVSEQLAISEMGSAFSKVWLWSLGAFFLFRRTRLGAGGMDAPHPRSPNRPHRHSRQADRRRHG